jgi:hypothetical protein
VVTAIDENADLQEVPQPIVEVREFVSKMSFTNARAYSVYNKRIQKTDQIACDLISEEHQHEQKKIHLASKDLSSVDESESGGKDCHQNHQHEVQ